MRCTSAVDWLKLAVVTKFNFCLKVHHHCQNLLIPADMWAALFAKHQWRTSAKRLLCKTPVIGGGGAPGEGIIFQLSCFSIFSGKMHTTSFHLIDVETVAFVCTMSDLLSKCYMTWPRAILVRATHWPRATTHSATRRLLTLFPVPYMSFG